jgi:glycopeptide antibiotics resistance protein
MSEVLITIRRPVTVALLFAATLFILLLTTWMSGKSYSKVDPIPFEDLRHLERRLERRPVSTHVVAVVLVPVVANVLLFVPFGFLLFLALYTLDRATLQTYLLTVLAGFTLTCCIEAWQYFLPSRVADVNDVIWNTTGTLAGAVLGHLRARLRFEFD